MTHTQITRTYWPDGDRWAEWTEQQIPGTADDGRKARIRRLKDARRAHTVTNGIVTYHDHHAEFQGEPAWDSRTDIEWIDDPTDTEGPS